MGKRISRREFLRQGVGVGLFLGAGIGLPEWLAASVFAPLPDLVAVKGDTVKAAEAAVTALGGMNRFVKPGSKVVIKPNISFSNTPEMASTTDPLLVKTLAQMCVQAGAERVTVVDHTIHHWRICLDKSGMQAALAGMNKVILLPLSQRQLFEEVAIPKGKIMKQAELARVLLQSDVMINVPIAKNHPGTQVTLSLKNLMGLVWDRGQMHRLGVEQAIADLATVAYSHLIVMDASRVLIDHGPGGPGKVMNLGTIVAGTNPVAVDAYTIGLAPWYDTGLAPREVRHLVLAEQMGLGQINLDKLKIMKLAVG